MVVLQAYQADLLKEMDEGDDIRNEDIAELRRATDLSLSATKETTRTIGWSKAALVATQRHLWLNLSQISEKDRVFLLDAPISPSGLFGNAVDKVVDRFQEAKKQAAAFQQFLPRRSQSGADRKNSLWAPLIKKSPDVMLQVWGPSFSIRRLRPKGPEAISPGHLKAGPSGEGWHTPQYTVPVSPRSLQEIVPFPLPPSVLQDTAISSKFLSQPPPGIVVVLRSLLLPKSA